MTATIGVAERDPVDPLPVETRTAIARRLLDRAGFRVRPAEGAVGQVDAAALVGAARLTAAAGGRTAARQALRPAR